MAIAHIVTIPPNHIQGALHVIHEFCGPQTRMGEWIDGKLTWPTVEIEDEIYGHFHGETPKGIRFVTHIQDLADRIQGYLEAQEE